MSELSPVPTDTLLSPQQISEILATDATAVRVLEKGLSPSPGDLVGVRLNLNVLKSTGQAIQTIHRATNKGGYRRNHGFYNGEACGYAQAVVLKNAYFNVNQSGRESIASGKQHKFPMASVDGEFVSCSVPDGFDGLAISFNPKSHHLFVDAEGLAIHHAQEVVVLGNRVYARGVSYYTPETAPAKRGTTPSSTQFKSAVSELSKPRALAP